MARRSKRARGIDAQPVYRSRFSLGKITAETDPLLSETFLTTPDYESIVSRDTPSAFIVGRTGSGKSAILRHLEATDPERVIFLSPERLALAHISNHDIVRQLDERGVRLEPFFRPLWERVFVSEIIHHRYQGRSADDRVRLVERIRSFFTEDPTKRRALKDLEDLTEDFWCTTEERVEKTVETLSESLQLEGGFGATARTNVGPASISIGAGSSANDSGTHTMETTVEERDRAQRIVNQAELTKLRDALAIIQHHVLDSPQQFTYLLIDDLDRYLVDEPIRAKLLRCLFEAVIDMATQVPYLKILVALRTNIFRQLDYGSQRYGIQEEKAEDLIIPLKWTKADLIAVLDQRVRVASTRIGINPSLTLFDILPNKNAKRDPLDFILSRTLMRPRDCILFLNTAIEVAEGRRKLSWDHLRIAEDIYSDKQLRALREEWKDPFIEIDKVLLQFKRKPSRLSWNELKLILDNVAIDVLHATDFKGKDWLEPMCKPIWDSAPSPYPNTAYMALVQLLFEIGFLGVTSQNGHSRGRILYCYHLTETLTEEDVDEDVAFEVHPAFRPALQMSTRWTE